MGKIAAKLDELFGMDIRAMALLRIGLSAIIFLQCLDHFAHVRAFYADDGVLPVAHLVSKWQHWRLCLNLLNGSWQFQFFLLTVLAAAALSLMVGYRTRLCTLIVWILLCSFHNRNWLILGAEDKLLHVLFFWFLFIPWGACYSLDNAGSRCRIVPLRISTLGTTAYLFQIACFYGFAGLLKFMPCWTTDGTALHTVLSAKQFAKPFGLSLLQYPQLLSSMTFYTLYLERFAPLLLFFPMRTTFFRLAALAALALFHIGIMLCMELKYFQWICLITLIGFLPTGFLNKFLPVPAFADRAEQPPSRNLTWKPNLIQMPPYLSILLAALIVYVFVWNARDLRTAAQRRPPESTVIHPRLDWIGYALSLRQHWGMYGPQPFRDDGWFVMPGNLANGKTVDVFRRGAALTWSEPTSVIELNGHYSWTLYHMNIHDFSYRSNVLPWAEYICREWNETHTGPERLLNLRIFFMQRTIVPGKMTLPARHVPLISKRCRAQAS